jgi:flagellar basal body rod protein FlgG
MGTESSGTIKTDSAIDFSQGNLVETGRALDFALHGKGFFVVETPEGPVYTRNGMFQTNQNGQIIDGSGRVVAGDGGPITVPPTVGIHGLRVSGDGSINANGATIGKFRLVDFADNEDKLTPAGLNCFRMSEPDIGPQAAEHVVVRQGYQEASNVKMVDELVDMIMVSRLYESNMKFVSAKRETTGSIISVAMGQ